MQRNVIHDLDIGLYDNQFCFKIGNEGDGVVQLRDNVCRTDGNGLSQTNPEISPLVSSGNCYQVSRYAMEVDGPLPPGSYLDNDVFFSTDSDRFIKWNEVRYGTLREFQAATDLEPNGVTSEECPVMGRPTRTPVH